MLTGLAFTKVAHWSGSDEFIRLLACFETTPFYPQRGIPFSCSFDYSNSMRISERRDNMDKSMESQLIRSNIDSISRFSLKGGTNLTAFSSSNLEWSPYSIFQWVYLLDQI